MRQRGPINLLRSRLAALLGLSRREASDGIWWEIDLILVVLLGAGTLGVFAFLQL
jgi:hypothetical protein